MFDPIRSPLMSGMERGTFIQSAGVGIFAFTVNSAELLLTPREARAQGASLRTLSPAEAQTLDAVGETLVPGAKDAGITNFIDQQISIPPDEALLQLRIMNVAPPFANVYRAAVVAIDAASNKMQGRAFAQLAVADQHQFIDAMRQDKIDGWQGPPGSFCYSFLRNDAVDVVYSTVDGFAALGVPYMPHILPARKW
jgi:hypothetical protein